MKKFFIGILVLVSFCIVSNANNNHIKFKIPSISQSSDIPVRVIITDGLKKGDLLIVKADNKTAFELQTNGNEIIQIDAILRGLNPKISSTKISAVLIRKGGASESISKKAVYLGSNSVLKQDGKGSKKVKFRARKNKIKLLIKNQMAKNKYAQNLVLSTSTGTIKIKMTPILSRNPILTIIGKKDFGKVRANVTLSNVEYKQQ